MKGRKQKAESRNLSLAGGTTKQSRYYQVFPDCFLPCFVLRNSSQSQMAEQGFRDIPPDGNHKARRFNKRPVFAGIAKNHLLCDSLLERIVENNG
jgi:hypothetical protein